MRFTHRFLLLPMLSSLSLMAPAQAETLKMTSIYDVTLGMPLDEGISTLRDAGFVFKTSPSGDIFLREWNADHYEGAPAYFRTFSSTLEDEGVSTQLVALRVPNAAEDDWSISTIARVQNFGASELKPLHSELLSQINERIGAEEVSCFMGPDKLQYIYVFDEAGALVPVDDDGEFCENTLSSFQNGDFATMVMVVAEASDEDKSRVDTFAIRLSDGELAGLRKAIATGTYGKEVPTIGDF